jgi:hypothetical protein
MILNPNDSFGCRASNVWVVPVEQRKRKVGQNVSSSFLLVGKRPREIVTPTLSFGFGMIVFLAHVAATLTMFGVILVVQIVHYPLFAQVGAQTYSAYQSGHMARITWIVLPAMGVELVTAGWLTWHPPPGLPCWMTWTGLGLVAVIWVSTGLVQAPIHARLTRGFNPDLHRRLVATNWLRTAAWAARSALVLWMLARLLE